MRSHAFTTLVPKHYSRLPNSLLRGATQLYFSHYYAYTFTFLASQTVLFNLFSKTQIYCILLYVYIIWTVCNKTHVSQLQWCTLLGHSDSVPFLIIWLWTYKHKHLFQYGHASQRLKIHLRTQCHTWHAQTWSLSVCRYFTCMDRLKEALPC